MARHLKQLVERRLAPAHKHVHGVLGLATAPTVTRGGTHGGRDVTTGLYRAFLHTGRHNRGYKEIRENFDNTKKDVQK